MNKIKCNMCKKNIKLLIFDCKCNGKFCMEHRFSYTHNCNYDYLKDNQEKLLKDNPKIITNKINII